MLRIKISLIFLFAVAIHFTLIAQEMSSIPDVSYGSISDAKTKENLPFASVYFHELSSGATCDTNGSFPFPDKYEGKVRLTISCLGYQSLDTSIVVRKTTGRYHFFLQPSTFALHEVIVSAKEGARGNSTSLIGKEAMEHIQPSSFADLLQLLPGYSTQEINLSKANMITMRQAGSDANTSLGTAFMVDGSTLSNDGNLQHIFGINNDNLSNRLTTSSGIDMRTISTDKIESVEVVRGIPSARYGDLTAGLVKIELKNGKTPWEARAKVDLKNKLFSAGKGFLFSKAGRTLNVDLDHIMYNPDPRSDLTTYTRTTFSTRYGDHFRLSEKVDFLFRAGLNYTGSFDQVKKDPASLSKDDYLKMDYNNLTLSTKGTFRIKESFFKEIKYNLSFNYTKDVTDQVKLVSLGGTVPLTTVATEEMSYETGYLPAEYSSKLVIEGKPVNLGVNIDFISEYRQKNVFHSLFYGISYTYDKNQGKGAVYDPYLPPYNGSVSANTSINIRARAFRDVPAADKLSLYLEDHLNWKAGASSLDIQPGIRVTTLPGIGKDYRMQGKFYWEPRVNMKFTLPSFSILGKESSFSLTGGAGQLYKFPTMAQLYPEQLYFDYIELNYYSLNPDYRFAQVQTFIKDPTNYEIEPAANIKLEAGFVFAVGNIRFDLTFFREMMDNGFNSGQSVAFHTYRNYDASSGPANPIAKPSLNDFSYTDMSIASVYRKMDNNAGVYKTGIEYTLDMGTIAPLYTRIWLNGAWFKTHYKRNGLYMYKPSNALSNKPDEPYPYVGIYDYDRSDRSEQKSQFNTNVYFDTHVPLLKMIFTTSVQTMWRTTDQTDYYSGMPIAYMDVSGNVYDFDPALAGTGIFKGLVETYNAYRFIQNKTAMDVRVNLKLSKEIGNNIRLACYFNNLLTYLPDYTSARGTSVTNRNTGDGVTPYFGAELNIKF